MVKGLLKYSSIDSNLAGFIGIDTATNGRNVSGGL